MTQICRFGSDYFHNIPEKFPYVVMDLSLLIASQMFLYV